MKKSKLALVGAVVKSKMQAILGWPIAVFGVMGLCFYLPSPAEYGWGLIAFMFVLLAIGVLLLFLSLRTKKLVSKFRLYVSILSNQSSMSICELAMTLGESEEGVMNALQDMIDRHFFASAYIDKGRRCLVLPLMEKAVEEARTEWGEKPYTVVTCKVCGGDNRISVGSRCSCMYCDNLIQG